MRARTKGSSMTQVLPGSSLVLGNGEVVGSSPIGHPFEVVDEESGVSRGR